MQSTGQRLKAVVAGALLALAATAQPAEDVAEQVFSTRLQSLLEAKQWAEASRHLQQAQALRPAPVWLTARDAEVRFAHVRIAAGREDVSGALAAARIFLTGDEARTLQLLAFARELHAAGAKPMGIGLVKEIVRRTPAFTVAVRQLAEWEPLGEEKKPRVETKPAPEPKRAPEPKPPAAQVDEETSVLGRLRAAQEQGNIPAMLSAARRFLTGDRERSFRLLEVAREYAARGERTTAVALTKEVLRRTADFPPAKRQLAELESAAAK
jgi:hypothetical protein